MEDIPRNLEKNLIPPIPGQDKNKRSWQILFIDDHGRVIPVRQFKTIAVALISLLVVSVILAVTFFLLFITNQYSTSSSKDEIKQYKSQIKTLQNEVDILMARSVLTESLNKNDASENKTANTNLKKKPEPRESTSRQKENTKPSNKTVSKNETEKPIESEPEEKQEIEAKDFAFTYITYKNILRIRFTIRNINRRIRTVSGYIFLILKTDEDNPKTWITVPAVDIVAGKPSQIGRGQYFKISNYKTVHMKISDFQNPLDFKQAELYVFDVKGNILLHITEPFTIKTIQGVKPPVETETPDEETEYNETTAENPVTPTQDNNISASTQKQSPEQSDPGVQAPTDTPTAEVEKIPAVEEEKPPVSEE